jgi:hypothetical protein
MIQFILLVIRRIHASGCVLLIPTVALLCSYCLYHLVFCYRWRSVQSSTSLGWGLSTWSREHNVLRLLTLNFSLAFTSAASCSLAPGFGPETDLWCGRQAVEC